MEEFIKKLIHTLEEETDCPNCSMHCVDAHICGFDEMRKQTITIINDLVEEHNNNYCEWEEVYDDGIGIDSQYKPLCSEDGFIDITGYFDYKYCPYCGKKIKVLNKQVNKDRLSSY